MTNKSMVHQYNFQVFKILFKIFQILLIQIVTKKGIIYHNLYLNF